jgi:3-deoxy-D-manno-octulosonic-acid transferase
LKALYSTGIYLANVFIKGVSVFNKKLKLGVIGRSETFSKLKNYISKDDKTLWFHCASLGEYEQGLPVFQELREEYPTYKIVLSFFSPSGYEIRKNTSIADVVVYLPLDTPVNAKRFLDIVHPGFIIFVKYEIWPNLLHEIKRRSLRAILISATFRANQSFFKPYGGFMKNALFAFEHIFTQDEASKVLIENLGYDAVSVSGDTRFDRVSNQLKTNNKLGFIETFKANQTTIIFGSSWPEDDALFIPFINNYKGSDVKFIIAPHNIKPAYTASLVSQIKLKTVCYSDMANKNLADYPVFILDTIGQLSKTYSYADIAYVGGAAGSTGLHNILEPAVFGIPLIIGKNYDKFPEAKQLIRLKGLSYVTNTKEMCQTLKALIDDPVKREQQGKMNSSFINENKGAAIQIKDYIRI